MFQEYMKIKITKAGKITLTLRFIQNTTSKL